MTASWVGTYNLLVPDTAIDITASLELCHWWPPCRWIWVSARYVIWCSSPGKEPDTDFLARPFGNDNSSTISVEARTVGSCVLTLNVAACVRSLTWSIDVAIGSGKRSSKGVAVVDDATVRGVQSHGVVGLVVDTLDDIDLA